MANRIIKSVREFDQLLKDFSDKVKKGQYEKLDYQLWKRMNQCVGAIGFDFDHRCTIIRDDAGTCVMLLNDDNSLGTYLYKEMIVPFEVRDTLDWSPTLAPETAVSLNSSNQLFYVSSSYSDLTLSNYQTGFKCNEKEKEEDMKTPFNFDFGPVNSNTVRMSMYGLAVKNKSGTWVSYNPATDEIMDVEIFNFDGAKFLYKMPVAISAVKPGDVIIHAGVPMYVEDVLDKTLFTVDPVNGEKKEILLAKSPFGFSFVAKVVNFLEGAFGTSTEPSAENPFGNMWMFMALGDNEFDATTLALMSAAGGAGAANLNSMLPFLLMKNGDTNNLAMLMAFQSMNKNS